MNVAKTLTRDEMKSIMAGTDICGDIYCNIGGTQEWMGSGCNPEDPNQPMLNALSNCELEATLQSAQSGSDVNCNGCAQFPVDN
jgi:hypothetical protein